MDAQRYDQGRKQAVWFSPFLLVVALSPVFLQFQYTCERPGNTRLSSLEFEVLNVNRIAFDPMLRVYDVWLPAGATTVTIRAQAADPAAYTTWYVQDAGGSGVSGELGVGGGEVTLDLPPDGHLLGVGVYPSGGAIGRYTVNVNPLCPQGDPCHNGGLPGTCINDVCESCILSGPEVCDDGNECTAYSCDAVAEQCVYAPVADGVGCDFGGVDGVCDAGACRERSWGTPEALSGAEPTIYLETGLAMNWNGSAIAYRSVNRPSPAFFGRGHACAWTVHYAPNEGWANPDTVACVGRSDHYGRPQYRAPGIDAQGNAMLTYNLNGGFNNYGLSVMRFTPANGWVGIGGAPSVLSHLPYAPFSGDVAPDGTALYVRQRHAGDSIYRFWAMRFTPLNGLGAEEDIGSAGARYVGDVPILEPTLLAAGPAGDAIAFSTPSPAWGGSPAWDGGDEFYFNHFSATAGWQPTQPMGATGSGLAAAVDAAGGAVALWLQDDGGFNSVWSKRFTPSTGWGAAEPVEQDQSYSAGRPQISMDADGHVVAVWTQADQIWANRLIAGGSWGAAERISAIGTQTAMDPDVEVGPAGNAIALWSQDDGGVRSLWWNQFTPTSGWRTPQVLEDDGASSVHSPPQVGLDRFGNAIAVWERDDIVWSSRFE